MRALVFLLSFGLTGCVWSSSHPRKARHPSSAALVCTLPEMPVCGADGFMCSAPCKEGGMVWWITSYPPDKPEVPKAPAKKVSKREDKRPDYSSGEGIGPTPQRMQMHWIATGEPPP